MKSYFRVILSTVFILGSATALAAEGHHEVLVPATIPFVVVYQAINFSLLIALLYGLTRKKVRIYFSSRLETHELAKKSALQAFADAQERHAEEKKKLEGLHADESTTIERAKAEAMILKSKLIQEAEHLANNIISDAKKTAHYEFEKAKQDLRKETFEQALKLARTDIEKNLNEKDQKNLQRQFVDNIGTVQ